MKSLWMKLETRVRSHPKMIDAGAKANWFWVCACMWSRDNATDGFIPKSVIETIQPRITAALARKHVAKLLEVRLLDEAEGGYRIHDFLEFNPSRQEIEIDREWDRRRKELYSDADLIARIRARDDDRCRYCGIQVDWLNRRGPAGGQFDHINPRGDNSFENVVVSCRGCNNKKNNRTPQQAKMPLMEPLNHRSGTSSGPEPRTGSVSRGGGGALFSPSPSGSESGSSSVSGLDPEIDRSIADREIIPENARARGPVPSAAGPKPLDWWRKHASIHVEEFCDWVCFPIELRNEFARKVSGVVFEIACGQVDQWAKAVRDQWNGQVVPDGSCWDFWKHRWTETHGGSKPSGSAGFDPLKGVKEFMRRG